MIVVLLNFRSTEHKTYPYSLATAFLKAALLADPGQPQPLHVVTEQVCASDDTLSIAWRCRDLYADIVAISVASVRHLRPALQLVAALKGLAPQIATVLGGGATTGVGREVMNGCDVLDFLVKGEGEVTFCELVRGIHHRREFEQHSFYDVLGLLYREGGEIHETLDRPAVEALDSLPSPYEMTAARMSCVALGDTALLETSRGCRFHCAFCNYGGQFGRRRLFSLERIERELGLLTASGVTHLVLVDPVFNYERERTRELVEAINRQQRLVRITAWARADRFDEALLPLLAEKSWMLHCGWFCANEEMARVNNRGAEPLAMGRALQALAPLVKLELTLMYGLPGATPDDFRTHLFRALDLGPHRLRVLHAQALPGTDHHLHRETLRISVSGDLAEWRQMENGDWTSQAIAAARELGNLVELIYNIPLFRARAAALRRDAKLSWSDYFSKLLAWLSGDAARDVASLRSVLMRTEAAHFSACQEAFHSTLGV